MFLNGKNGAFWQTSIENQGSYTFELHQESLRGKQNIKQESGLGRSTIIVARLISPSTYEYVSSSMKFS